MTAIPSRAALNLDPTAYPLTLHVETGLRRAAQRRAGRAACHDGACAMPGHHERRAGAAEARDAGDAS